MSNDAIDDFLDAHPESKGDEIDKFLDAKDLTAEDQARENYIKQAQRPTLSKLGDLAVGIGKGLIKPLQSAVAGAGETAQMALQPGRFIPTALEAARQGILEVAPTVKESLSDILTSAVKNPLKALTPSRLLGEHMLNTAEKAVLPYTPNESEIANAEKNQEFRNAIQTESQVTPDILAKLGALPKAATAMKDIAPFLVGGPELKALMPEALTSPVANVLRESAAKDISQLLSPTTKAMKAKVERITPEILDRPISDTFSLTKKGLEVKAGIQKELAGEAIDAFGKLKGDVNPTRIVEALEKLKEPYFVEGKVIDQGAIDRIDGMQATFKQYGDSISKEGLREIRRTFDNQINESKGFFKDVNQGTELDLKKTASNEIRRILAEEEPDLAKLNKQFNFWSNLEDVISETNKRMKPQSGLTGNLAAIAGAASGSTPEGMIARAAIGKSIVSAVRSPGWKFVSAKIKNKLADAIAARDPVQINAQLKKIQSPPVIADVEKGQAVFENQFKDLAAKAQMQRTADMIKSEELAKQQSMNQALGQGELESVAQGAAQRAQMQRLADAIKQDAIAKALEKSRMDLLNRSGAELLANPVIRPTQGRLLSLTPSYEELVRLLKQKEIQAEFEKYAEELGL